MGYRLKRSVWGRGLATERSVGLIRRALEDRGEAVVIAATMAGNVASRRVMVKAGMVFEREFKESRWEGPDRPGVKSAARRGVWHDPCQDCG